MQWRRDDTCDRRLNKTVQGEVETMVGENCGDGGRIGIGCGRCRIS